MDGLLSQPGLQAWALASIVVALKTLSAGIHTSRIRMGKKVFSSPEDYAMQKLEGSPTHDQDVERTRRIHQNDLEAGLPFALVGLVYALTVPSTLGLWICFAGFPLARIGHGISYAKGLMPQRTIFWAVGFVIVVWMSASSLVSILF